MSDCPPRVKLLAIVAAGEHDPHLDECEDCANFVVAAAAAVSAFSDRRELEEAIAKEVDAILAETPPRRWSSTLMAVPEMRRSVIIRDLLRRADEMYGRDSRQALDLTTAALNICDAMTTTGQPPSAELQFETLKEHVIALQRMGRLQDALNTISRAWPIAYRTKESQLNRAILSLCGALVYVEPDIAKFDEAIELAETAEAVLEDFGEMHRAIIARQTKAFVLLVMNRFDEALPLLRYVTLDLENTTGESRDTALAYTQLAECLAGIGSFAEAVENASTAERLHRLGSNLPEAARSAHIRCRAISALGRFNEVRDEFARSAEVLFTAKLFDAWAIMRLEYVEAALADDEGADVRSELESVVRVCMTVSATETGQRQRYAAEAMDYLRQLAIRDALTSEAVKLVREFVVRNASRPPVRFTPPPGAFLM